MARSDSLRPERPSLSEVARKSEALLEHLGPKFGTLYTNRGLVKPGGETPRDEPTRMLGFACVYPAETGQEHGRYLLIGSPQDVPQLPSRSALRRNILSYEVRAGALEDQELQAALWNNPVGREVIIEQVAEVVRPQELPMCFIAFGRVLSGRSRELVSFLYYHPAMPSDGALDLIRRAVEDTMADEVG